MPTISLRQALTPTGNWVILDVHDSTTSVMVDGMLRPAGVWTYVYIYNPNTSIVTVVYEILDPEGLKLVTPTNLVIPPHVTAYVRWDGPKFETGTMLLRCPQPILPAAYRGRGSERTTLVVHPMLAG